MARVANAAKFWKRMFSGGFAHGDSRRGSEGDLKMNGLFKLARDSDAQSSEEEIIAAGRIRKISPFLDSDGQQWLI